MFKNIQPSEASLLAVTITNVICAIIVRKPLPIYNEKPSKLNELSDFLILFVNMNNMKEIRNLMYKVTIVKPIIKYGSPLYSETKRGEKKIV